MLNFVLQYCCTVHQSVYSSGCDYYCCMLNNKKAPTSKQTECDHAVGGDDGVGVVGLGEGVD